MISTQNVEELGDDQRCLNTVWTASCVTTLKVTHDVCGKAKWQLIRDGIQGLPSLSEGGVWGNDAVRSPAAISTKPTSSFSKASREGTGPESQHKASKLELSWSLTLFAEWPLPNHLTFVSLYFCTPHWDFLILLVPRKRRHILPVECSERHRVTKWQQLSPGQN